MRVARALLCLLSLCLVITGAPPPAHAEDPTEARAKELFENGARLYEEGQYDDAVMAWQAAYQLSPRPLLLFNMANAYERLGRYQEAYDFLNRYRALAPSDERETLERRIRNIEKRIAEVRERAANAPDVDPLMDTSGSRMTVTNTTKSASTGPHPAGIALVIGGGAAMGIGAVLDGLALRERASTVALCKEGPSATLLCPSNAEPHIVLDRRLSAGGDIALIAGGVALGAGIIVLIVDATSGTKTAVHLVPSVAPGAAALTLLGRF